MKLDQHYVDPRLVELYDRDNPRGADTDFYLRLAADLDARRVRDGFSRPVGEVGESTV